MRCERLELAAVKAGPLTGVTGRPGGLDERQQGVAVAVVADRLDRLCMAGGRTLMPQLLARAAEEVCLACFAREPERFGVHVGERQDLAGAPVLHDARHESVLVVCDLGVVHLDWRFWHGPDSLRE